MSLPSNSEKSPNSVEIGIIFKSMNMRKKSNNFTLVSKSINWPKMVPVCL